MVRGNGVEIFAQISGEIQRDLPGFSRILLAKVIDTHHGIVNEMRAHLQHQDTGLKPDIFLQLAHILLTLVRKDHEEQ